MLNQLNTRFRCKPLQDYNSSRFTLHIVEHKLFYFQFLATYQTIFFAYWRISILWKIQIVFLIFWKISKSTRIFYRLWKLSAFFPQYSFNYLFVESCMQIFCFPQFKPNPLRQKVPIEVTSLLNPH